MSEPAIGDRLPEHSRESPAEKLAVELAEALAESWQRGQPCRAEDFLAEHPSLTEDPRAAVHLIYEEYCQRQERGLETTASELHTRFPRWASELDVLIQCHRLLDLAPATIHFPKPGEELADFQLLCELGRGGQARVYLAEQAFLAGRLIVLKVVPLGGHEHLSLARLQHTHIVPLYAVREVPDRQLQTLCMPCLGGTTLDRILQALQGIEPARRTGADLRAALTRSASDPRMLWDGRGTSWKYLERATFPQAICWIGMCIAEALQHAHERGLVHLDIKPSNVLLSADGVPMLLDFHLAREPVPAGAPTPDWLGGTPVYMSPEQKAAWRAVSERSEVPHRLDGRSDIWSLALVMAEALRGRTKDAATLSGRAVRHIPVGLRDILTRALSADASARYLDAASFAEDLRRQLTDRPLLGVRNRGPIERWKKWRRRQPHALTVALLLFVVFAIAGTLSLFAWLHYRQRTDAAETALATGQAALARRTYREAYDTFSRAEESLRGLPLVAPLATALQDGTRHASRGLAAHALHDQVEHLRYFFGDNSLTPESLEVLDHQCLDVWTNRRLFLDAAGAVLADDEEVQIRTDLLDTTVLWSDFHSRLGGTNSREEIVGVLDEAESVLGASAALTCERRNLGATDAPLPQPRSAWDHYAVGRHLLRQGNLDAAAALLQTATALQPREFWPWFWQGQCAYRQKKYPDAVTAFTVCIALEPRSGECFHNRSLAQSALGRSALAWSDCDAALKLAPTLAAAMLQRGLLQLKEKHTAEAIADLNQALTLGADPASTYFNLALAYQQQQNRSAALASVEEALRRKPDHREARELRDRLRRP